eukprot:TRINITY_DN267_c2_g1_i1.p1 TRINITY_DN267_c2_g1~~TRINITY_DN267_c2_g1_i1.p1  ORF type:complete len:558 (-),score=70.54 TRINITY_DN267_c2_g1_i1:47-1513(-)
MHKKYLHNLVYYNLQVDKVIDNPDQRIAADLRSLFLGIGTDNPWSRGLVETYARSTRAVVLIVGIGLYTFFQISWLPPVLLIVWNVISYIPVHFLMKWLSEAVYKKEMKEGDFRYLQAHIRENSESIAFYKAEEKILAQSLASFDELLDSQWANLISKFQLDFVSQSLAVLNDVIAPCAILLGVHWGIGVDFYTMTPESRTAVYSSMTSLLHKSSEAMLSLFEVVPSLASLAGSGSRVAEFLEVSHRLAHERAAGEGIYKSNTGQFVESEELKLQNVTASTPEGLPVVQDLNLHLKAGDNLLIMGPSGCGKSSLFRVLKGLWPLQNGVIEAPFSQTYKGIFFLSQSAYFVSGTLREQMIYPHKESLVSDAVLLSFLSKVGIDYIATRSSEGLDQYQLNWEKILSGGEQQRLVLCRLLYHKPLYAAMDESTSAVDQDMEKRLYKLVHEAGVTTFSIGHRESLMKLHKYLLQVGTQHGCYNLIDLQTPTG